MANPRPPFRFGRQPQISAGRGLGRGRGRGSPTPGVKPNIHWGGRSESQNKKLNTGLGWVGGSSIQYPVSGVRVGGTGREQDDPLPGRPTLTMVSGL